MRGGGGCVGGRGGGVGAWGRAGGRGCGQVRLDAGGRWRRIDVRVYPRRCYAFALLHMTGSDHFNRPADPPARARRRAGPRTHAQARMAGAGARAAASAA